MSLAPASCKHIAKKLGLELPEDEDEDEDEELKEGVLTDEQQALVDDIVAGLEAAGVKAEVKVIVKWDDDTETALVERKEFEGTVSDDIRALVDQLVDSLLQTVTAENEEVELEIEFELRSAAEEEDEDEVPEDDTEVDEDLDEVEFEEEIETDFDENPFPDTDATGLEGKAAAELHRRGVIGGFPDGQFKGHRDVNRAQAAKFLLLARYEEVEEVLSSGQFPDVKEGKWYTKYVITSAILGVIDGYEDGTFKPGNTVNTAEFLKMLTLAFDLETDLEYSYRDIEEGSWYEQYVGIAEKYDLFPKRKNNLKPDKLLTRTEVAIAIYQYLINRDIEPEEVVSAFREWMPAITHRNTRPEDTLAAFRAWLVL